MVPEMPNRCVVMLFIKGRHDRLRGLVKALKPRTLHEAIQTTLDLETTPPPTSYQSNKKFSRGSKPFQRSSTQHRSAPPPPRMDQDTWELGHICLGKGKAHLIEVYSDVDDEHVQDTVSEGSHGEDEQDTPQVELGETETLGTPKVTIAMC